MAVQFLHSASASRGLEFWDATGGSPTIDQTTPHTGDSSILFNATGESVTKNNVMTDDGRLSIYVRLSGTPANQFVLARLGFAGGEEFDVEINTSRQVVLTGNTLNKTGSTAIATGTWTQIALRRDIVSTSSYTINVYVDGSAEDFNATGADGTLNSGGSNSFQLGIISGSAGVDVRSSDEYVDDVDVAEYPGDIRVAWKKAGTVNNNNFDTTTGSGAVDESPFSTTNGMEHTASSDVAQDYSLIAESDTDGGASEDLTDKAIIARTAFIWAQRDNGGSGSPDIIHDGTLTAITLNNGSPTLHIVNEDNAAYPDNAAAIGLQSTDASADSHLYEAGYLIAYFGDTMSFTDAQFADQSYQQAPRKLGSNFYCFFFDKNHTAGPTRGAAFEATDPSNADASDWTNVGEVGFDQLQKCAWCVGAGGDLHVATQDTGDGSTGRVRYHLFDPGGGTWTVRHDVVSNDGGTAGTTSSCAMEVRSNGDVLVAYIDSTGADLKYSRKEGTWTRDVLLDDNASRGVVAVLGASDRIHFVYERISGNMREISVSSLNAISSIHDTGEDGSDTHPLVPGISYDDGGTIKVRVGFKEVTTEDFVQIEFDSGASPSFSSRQIDDTVNIANSTIDSAGIAIGCLAVDGTTTIAMWADDTDNDLYRDEAENGAAYGTDVEEQDGVTINRISCEVYDHSGTVLAWFQDNAGTVEYYEVARAAATSLPNRPYPMRPMLAR